MSTTTFGVNDPLAVKIWSKKLAKEAYFRTYIGKFIGKSEDSLIQEKVDLKKAAGDKITCGLNIQLQGDGVQGDATLEGNEESLVFYDDALFINQLRHASKINGKMTEQRVPYNLRDVSKNRLADWFARRMETSFFNQICGNTAQTDTRYTGNNATVAPSTNRIIYQGGQSNDQGLTSADTFTLDLIDVVKTKAITAETGSDTGPVMRPIRYKGGDYFVMFLHPYQVNDLRTNTSTGQWLDIQEAAMKGGDVKDNPIFTGALGIYNGVVLHSTNYVTQGVNSSSSAAISTVRRAVLCGAQAATVAFGADGGPNRFSWNEKTFDYGNQFGVKAGAIFGIKKTKFIPADDSSTNAEDFGTYVVSTYADTPSTS